MTNGGSSVGTFAPAGIPSNRSRSVFSQPALPFPNVPSTPKSHHVACNAKLRLRLSNFSERNSCYKHQIYTDSHIAGEPEFCPLVLLRLDDRAHVIRQSANRRPRPFDNRARIRVYDACKRFALRVRPFGPMTMSYGLLIHRYASAWPHSSVQKLL